MNYMFSFYQQYQFFTYFAVEYVSRLKAQAASIILNLASISYESPVVADSNLFYPVERAFILQTAGEIVRPLLNTINQERIYFLKKWSAQALVKLLKVAKKHNLAILNRKTLTILVKMMEQPLVETDSMGAQRLRTCEVFTKELVKQTKNATIYEDYGGVLGNLLLKPAWTQVPHQITGAYGPEVEESVHFWAHAVSRFVKSQVSEEKIPESLRLRYRILGFGALVKLIIRAMRILGQSQTL